MIQNIKNERLTEIVKAALARDSRSWDELIGEQNLCFLIKQNRLGVLTPGTLF